MQYKKEYPKVPRILTVFCERIRRNGKNYQDDTILCAIFRLKVCISELERCLDYRKKKRGAK